MLKNFGLLFLLAASCGLFCGCRGIQSEVQKSKILHAPSTDVIGGTELRLQTSLKRTFHADGRKFDLSGELSIVAANGSWPEGVEVYHMALKPGWRGWPGYYVLNFTERNGVWNLVDTGMNNRYLTFLGRSKREPGKTIIDFTWRDLGGLMTEKPKHFATYDVSVTLSDSQKQRYRLTNLQIPTD